MLMKSRTEAALTHITKQLMTALHNDYYDEKTGIKMGELITYVKTLLEEKDMDEPVNELVSMRFV